MAYPSNDVPLTTEEQAEERALQHERRAMATNAVLHVMEQRGRTRATDRDAQYMHLIANMLDELANGRHVEDSQHIEPHGATLQKDTAVQPKKVADDIEKIFGEVGKEVAASYQKG